MTSATRWLDAVNQWYSDDIIGLIKTIRGDSSNKPKTDDLQCESTIESPTNSTGLFRTARMAPPEDQTEHTRTWWEIICCKRNVKVGTATDPPIQMTETSGNPNQQLSDQLKHWVPELHGTPYPSAQPTPVSSRPTTGESSNQPGGSQPVEVQPPAPARLPTPETVPVDDLTYDQLSIFEDFSSPTVTEIRQKGFRRQNAVQIDSERSNEPGPSSSNPGPRDAKASSVPYEEISGSSPHPADKFNAPPRQNVECIQYIYPNWLSVFRDDIEENDPFYGFGF